MAYDCDKDDWFLLITKWILNNIKNIGWFLAQSSHSESKLIEKTDCHWL